jgi:2-polyprenyl-6-methoxyphenol hydroxylase-like FAD-dependent oxidoreductase
VLSLLLPSGQGVNSALEDVCVLEQEVFERAGGDLSQALPAFEDHRLPDSAALIKLVQVGWCGCTRAQLGRHTACSSAAAPARRLTC